MEGMSWELFYIIAYNMGITDGSHMSYKWFRICCDLVVFSY